MRNVKTGASGFEFSAFFLDSGQRRHVAGRLRPATGAVGG
jgi:hypothetical protein